VLNAGQETAWKGAGGSGWDDKLIARDRHAFMNGDMRIPGAGPGFTDPPMDGPIPPSLRVVNRTIKLPARAPTHRRTG